MLNTDQHTTSTVCISIVLMSFFTHGIMNLLREGTVSSPSHPKDTAQCVLSTTDEQKILVVQ